VKHCLQQQRGVICGAEFDECGETVKEADRHSETQPTIVVHLCMLCCGRLGYV
jgi:hypothetical protein